MQKPFESYLVGRFQPYRALIAGLGLVRTKLDTEQGLLRERFILLRTDKAGIAVWELAILFKTELPVKCTLMISECDSVRVKV